MLLLWKDHIRSVGEKGHNINKDILYQEDIFLSYMDVERKFSKSDGDQEIKTRAVRG